MSHAGFGSEEIEFEVTSEDGAGAGRGEGADAAGRRPAGASPPRGPWSLYRVERGELAFCRRGRGGRGRASPGGRGDGLPAGASTIRNASDRDAAAFVVHALGDDTEAFVRAAARLAAAGAPAVERVLAVAAEHGIEITRPLAEVADGESTTAIRLHRRSAATSAALLAAYRSSAETMNGVGRDHGLLAHVAAPTDEGLVMVNVWPSPDGSEAGSARPAAAARARRGADRRGPDDPRAPSRRARGAVRPLALLDRRHSAASRAPIFVVLSSMRRLRMDVGRPNRSARRAPRRSAGRRSGASACG